MLNGGWHYAKTNNQADRYTTNSQADQKQLLKVLYWGQHCSSHSPQLVDGGTPSDLGIKVT
jgi:hypothetical protein